MRVVVLGATCNVGTSVLRALVGDATFGSVLWTGEILPLLDDGDPLGVASDAEVESEAGDSDPALAVEDALQRFDADEIVLVGGAEGDTSVEESVRRFGVPTSRVAESHQPRRRTRLGAAVRGVESGRSSAAPFAFLLGVTLVWGAIAGLLTALVVLILWLI